MASESHEAAEQKNVVIWFDDEIEAFSQVAREFSPNDARVVLCETDQDLLHKARGKDPHPTLLCALLRDVQNELLQSVFQLASIRGVVSDLNIRGDALAGLRILTLASASPQRPELVLYSSSSDSNVEALAKSLGVHQTLSKRDPGSLVALVKEWLHVPRDHVSEKVEELTERLRSADRKYQLELDGLRRRNQRLQREKGALKRELEAANIKRGARALRVVNSKELAEKSARLQKLERMVQMALAHNHDLSNTSSLTLKTLEHLCADTKLVPPVLLADLQRARITAKHCDILVQSLASISGNEKSSSLKSSPSRLEGAVTDVCDILRRKVPDAINLKVEIPPKLPLCSIPMHLLVRVLMNILLNSLEAMPRGGAISIKARSPRATEKNLSLEVRDSGTGIRKTDISKVSNPDFSTKGKRQGFGLFIVQRVMADYKGKMTLSSVRGKGTTVILDLPTI